MAGETELCRERKPLEPKVEAWLVIAADGFRYVCLDHTQALNYAARCHGVVRALGIIG